VNFLVIDISPREFNAAINGGFKLHFCHKMERSGMEKMQLKNHPFDCFVSLDEEGLPTPAAGCAQELCA
jgi:hypothetical protein